MLFVGSSAGCSSSSAQLGIGKTYSRLLQLLDRCSEVDGVTYLHGLSHNDLMAAQPWRWRDRCLIEQRSAMAVVNE